MNTADRIRMFRQLMGWTQEYAGALLGLKQRDYARIETVRRTASYENLIKDFAMLIGVRFAYLMYGTPPAIAKGWLYFELPPKKLRQAKGRIPPRAINDLRHAVDELFPQFLWEHFVQSYRLGELNHHLRYYTYQIAPHATLTIKAIGEFCERLDLISEKLSLSLDKFVTISDIGEISEDQNPDDAKVIAKLYSELGIKVWADFLKEFEQIRPKLESSREGVRQKALERLCIMILDLGVDPADVWRKLEEIRKSRDGKKD